jgi:lipid-A-disaccharide synthase
MNSELKVFITAGEASGDALGARLMQSLKKQHEGKISFSGVGGPLMQAQGLRSLFPMTDLSVMGLAEVLPRLFKIMGRIRETAQAAAAEKPDLFITIDAPDFSFRVAKRVRKLRGDARPRMIHYVAPTVWAWRENRTVKVASLYDGIICLFPFETPYFEKENMKACFAGHPVLEGPFAKGNGAIFRKQRGIPETAPTLGVLFGSRRGELKRTAPALRQAAFAIAAKRPDMELIVPTLPHLADSVTRLLDNMPCNVHIVVDPEIKGDAFAAMDTAMAVSGTVGLELAVAGVPHVIAYRMNRLTFEIGKRIVKVKYAHLANILLNRPVVPELIQDACTPERLAEELRRIEKDPYEQKEAFAKLCALLMGENESAPSEQAARFVLSFLNRN